MMMDGVKINDVVGVGGGCQFSCFVEECFFLKIFVSILFVVVLN